MEKLYELHHGGLPDIPDFDLVVVDTPPTRNALDFLDAPRRLTNFLDNRVFRLLMMPTPRVPEGRECRHPDVSQDRVESRRGRGGE